MSLWDIGKGIINFGAKTVTGKSTPGLPAEPEPTKDQAGSWAGPPVPNPYTTGPGLQPGQKAPGLEWLNYGSGPISGEYYSSNRSGWENPSFGEQNAQHIVGQYSDPASRPQTTNNTQSFFDQYRANMPTVNSDPGFGAYYDNAKNRAGESINQTMAARGAYGSSAANDQISRAFTDLEADRAKNEADYNLKRLGENRAWQSLGGSLAGQADQNSLARSSEDRNWESLLGQLGLDSSRFGLARTNAGMDAANAASAEKSRVQQQHYDQEAGMGDRMSDLMMKTYMQMLGMDSEFFDKLQSGNLAAGNTAAANDRQNMQDGLSLADAGMKGYDYFKNQ